LVPLTTRLVATNRKGRFGLLAAVFGLHNRGENSKQREWEAKADFGVKEHLAPSAGPSMTVFAFVLPNKTSKPASY
jgi:hypothetical protein